eukprot:12260214-Ditylum_brightwellii.AAC.1
MGRGKNKAKSEEASASTSLSPPTSPSKRGSSKSPIANSSKNRKWRGIKFGRRNSHTPAEADDTNEDPSRIPPSSSFPSAMPGLEDVTLEDNDDGELKPLEDVDEFSKISE